MKAPWYRALGRALVAGVRQIPRQFRALERWLVDYFGTSPPTLAYALAPLILLSVILFVRHPATNYIFDEQEALLANPYVNATQGLKYLDAIHRDFWGLPPDASIGSYRPIPDLIWRATWVISKHPFFHHIYNLIFHGLNGALLGAFAFAVSKRRAVGWLAGVLFVSCAVLTEAVSGIVGIADVLGGLGAVLALSALRLPAATMGLGVFFAVSFGLFCKESALVCVPLIPAVALLTAPALHPQRPARWIRGAIGLVAAAGAFIVYVELRRAWFPAPLSAELNVAPPEGAGQLRVLYHDFLVWFQQAPLPKDPLNNPLADADFPHRVAGALRVYWRGLMQVLFPLRLSGDYSFPQEPIPESLWEWETVAGGLAMVLPLLGGLGLLLLSWWRERRDKARLVPAGALADALADLFGPSSGARPPGQRAIERLTDPPLVLLPHRGWHGRRLRAALVVMVAASAGLVTEVVMLRLGGPSWVRTWPWLLAVMVVGLGLLVDGWRGQQRPMQPVGPWPWRHSGPVLVAAGLVWMVVSYFPHSNIPVLLPTVRAERFWYFPAIGSSLVLAVVLAWLAERVRGVKVWRVSLGALLIAAFLAVQGMQAYRHSMDYRDDLAFWRATKNAVPNSSKAHLNYSVMVGARGDLETRLRESLIAAELAPEWAMAHVYTGDTLCRLHRPHDAWPHYAKGFELGPNERSLISLALQCLYDEKALTDYDKELRAMATELPGSWVAYLATDTLDNHEKHQGVDPQYRPRGYNQGPKE